jgi:hypothetical protein
VAKAIGTNTAQAAIRANNLVMCFTSRFEASSLR